MTPRRNRTTIALALLVLVPFSAPHGAWATISTSTQIGPSPNQAGFGISNTGSKATGFHFTYALPSAEQAAYTLTSATISTTPSGTVTNTPINFGGHLVGYDVDVTGISVAHHDEISISAKSTATDGTLGGNFAKISDVTFSYPTGPSNVAPDWQYHFSNAPVRPGRHTCSYTFQNMDAARTIVYSTIDFRIDSTLHEPGTALGGTVFYFAPGGTLPPGQSVTIPLNVPLSPKKLRSFITASGTMQYTGFNGGINVAYANSHEEQVDTTTVPSLTTWGIVFLTLLLVVGGARTTLKRSNAVGTGRAPSLQ